MAEWTSAGTARPGSATCNKIWLTSEGFATGAGKVADGQNQVLYGRSVSTWLDAVAGIRADLDSGTGRTWAALGVRGLAPMFIDYEATAYLSDQGHAAAHRCPPIC